MSNSNILTQHHLFSEKLSKPLSILGVIPARYASSRLPGKPLLDVAGKSMIQRVYEQVLQVKAFTKIVVATDDNRIFEHVSLFGGDVFMTAESHESGTDRCAEVSKKCAGFDVVINIQGDEPFINPSQIETLITCFDKPTTQIATLVKKINKFEDLMNVNMPKVVLNVFGEAIYFSRSTIPYYRGVSEIDWLTGHDYYKHIGIYGYRTEILNEITTLPVSRLEQVEALEQLRWLENGYKIQTAITDIETRAVDTQADLEALLANLNNGC